VEFVKNALPLMGLSQKILSRFMRSATYCTATFAVKTLPLPLSSCSAMCQAGLPVLSFLWMVAWLEVSPDENRGKGRAH
jgi:hypothetical protein